MTTKTKSVAPDRSTKRETRKLSHLFVVMQAASPLSPSSRHCLDNIDEVVIGRGPRSVLRTSEGDVRQLRISVPDSCLSSVHARVRVQTASSVLEDAGSKNGTFVNGDKIVCRELADRDIVEIGETLVLFRRDLPTPRALTEDSTSSDLGSTCIAMQTLLPQLSLQFSELSRIANSSTSIVLSGPTGSGKELMAKGIHDLSQRRGPFIPVNCGAISPALVESELFGHIKGAFSGAEHNRKGVFESADGGTVFLDEIGELPAGAQIALLRVLEEGKITRVGSTKAITSDFRVVCATHRNLRRDVEEGRFREDLFARISGYECTLPALRDRTADVGVITATVLRTMLGDEASKVKFSVKAALALVGNHWPHNVRGLKKSLEVALALSTSGTIEAKDLKLSEEDSLSEKEEEQRGQLLELLSVHRGNVTHMAASLGKKRQQVQKWLKRYGLDAADYR